MPLKILSSSEGRINCIVVTLPLAPDEHVNRYYSEIQDAFAHREMVIRYRNYEPPRQEGRKGDLAAVTESDPEARLRALLEGREVFNFFGESDFHREYVGDLIEALRKGIPIANSEWAQDPFCVLTNGNGTSVFLQPLYSRRYMDKFISLKLATMPELEMLIKPTELLLEGGNILAGTNYALAGKDLLAQNLMRLLERNGGGATDEEIRDQLEFAFRRELGVEHLIWVGYEHARENWKRKGEYTYQPDFHLDLFLTPGGHDAEGKHIIFMADPELTNSLLRKNGISGQAIISRRVVERFTALRAFWEDYDRKRSGTMPRFKIVPVPIVVRQDVVMSLNNCLVEIDGTGKGIYLPDYEVDDDDDRYERLNPAFKVLKAEMEAILRHSDHEFTTVKWIGPGRFFRKLAQMRGSLHCITKVLKRSAQPSSSQSNA